MKNMISILKNYNKKILAGNEKQCNCRKKDECPLENKYLTHELFMRQMSSPITRPESFILGYLVLHPKSVIRTINVILKTRFMRKAMSFQNIFEACRKVV